MYSVHEQFAIALTVLKRKQIKLIQKLHVHSTVRLHVPRFSRANPTWQCASPSLYPLSPCTCTTNSICSVQVEKMAVGFWMSWPFCQSPDTCCRSDQRAKCLHSAQSTEPCSSGPCRHCQDHQHAEHLLPTSAEHTRQEQSEDLTTSLQCIICTWM